MVSSRRGDRSGPGRGPSPRSRSSAAGTSRRRTKSIRRIGTDASPKTASGSQNSVAEHKTGQPDEAPKRRDRTSTAGAKRDRRRYGLTARAIALAVVLLILTISYASSLRVYFNQHHDIAETKADIARSQKHIDELHDEIDRWHDRDYVRIQARERLGWVKPGETGYRVVGSDGEPVTKTIGIAEDSGSDSDAEQKSPWYNKLWGTVKHADQPPQSDAKHNKKPITEDTKPTSGPR